MFLGRVSSLGAWQRQQLLIRWRAKKRGEPMLVVIVEKRSHSPDSKARLKRSLSLA